MFRSSPRPEYPPVSDAGTISAVAIPTRNRAAALRRCLESLLDNLAQHNREPRIIVVDSSTCQSAIDENSQSICDVMHLRHAKPAILHVTPGDVEYLIQDISRRAGIDQSIVAFSLKGMPDVNACTGASRNVHLLHTQGKFTITIDDDIICRTFGDPLPSPAKLIYGNTYARTSFYSDQASVEQALHSRDIDLLGAHEAVLGQSLDDCTNRVQAELQLATEGALLELRALDLGAARIRTTVMGVAGTITTDSPIKSYFRALADGSCIPDNESHHKTLLTAGQTITRASAYLIGRRMLTSSYCLGLDNSVLLPPWLPVLRSQDLVFGALLNVSRMHDLACLLPWSVLHDRPEGRSFSREGARRRFGQVNGGELIHELIDSLGKQATPSENTSLFDVGEYLMEFASGNPNSFRTKAKDLGLRVIHHRLQFLESVLFETASCASYIREDVGAAIQSIRRDMASHDYSATPDLQERRQDASMALQAIITQYGQLMKCWNDIAEAAREALEQPRGKESCAHL